MISERSSSDTVVVRSHGTDKRPLSSRNSQVMGHPELAVRLNLDQC
jgi:hypothetical protein